MFLGILSTKQIDIDICAYVLFRSIGSEDVLWPVGGDAPDAEEAPTEAESPAEGDAGGDEEEKEDEEEDETPMVDIPIIEEKKPWRKAKKQELEIDELAEKLAPFTYRNERSGRVSLRYMI